jgi:hypothetical protein
VKRAAVVAGAVVDLVAGIMEEVATIVEEVATIEEEAATTEAEVATIEVATADLLVLPLRRQFHARRSIFPQATKKPTRTKTGRFPCMSGSAASSPNSMHSTPTVTEF